MDIDNNGSIEFGEFLNALDLIRVGNACVNVTNAMNKMLTINTVMGQDGAMHALLMR